MCTLVLKQVWTSKYSMLSMLSSFIIYVILKIIMLYPRIIFKLVSQFSHYIVFEQHFNSGSKIYSIFTICKLSSTCPHMGNLLLNTTFSCGASNAKNKTSTKYTRNQYFRAIRVLLKQKNYCSDNFRLEI